VREEVDRTLDAAIGRVDELLDEITLINRQIAETEAGVGQENALRDRRDVLVDELAQFMEISVVEQPNGAVDVLVGSIPVVLGGQSRGIELRTEPVGDSVEVSVRVAADGTTLTIESGRIGGLLRQREQTVEAATEDLDTFAAELIFQVNRVHAQGQGQKGFSTVTGTEPIGDATVNLNAGLNNRLEAGSFFIHVTHAGSGVRTAHQIDVDGDAMSLNDLIAQINGAVPNVTASAGLGNRLQLDSAAGYEISFSDDARGALAALGLNTFFTGSGAGDIDVNQALVDDPGRLAAGGGHVAGSNATALAIANLQDEKLDALGGASLREHWQNSVNSMAVRTNAARGAADSSRLVRESLSAQVQAVSGVSLDEEAISLLTFQRQFQAAARFISVIDETLQTLLSIA
jgi:flagellar hook-associated protein 1 FlgK